MSDRNQRLKMFHHLVNKLEADDNEKFDDEKNMSEQFGNKDISKKFASLKAMLKKGEDDEKDLDELQVIR